MNKALLIILIIIGLFASAHAQTLDEVLEQIEKNNLELKAQQQKLESEILGLKTEMNLDNPSVSYGYFPENSSVPGTKQTFEVSQSFEFPTVYGKRKARIDYQAKFMEASYNLVRQEILLEASKQVIHILYDQKMQNLVRRRFDNAKALYDAFKLKYDKGDANILELNKAKLHYADMSGKLKQAEMNYKSAVEKLELLNGNKKIAVEDIDFPAESLISQDSLVAERLEKAAQIKIWKLYSKVAQKNIKLVQHEKLPDMTIGYGSEKVADEAFRGLVVGITIPLWEDRKKVDQARAENAYSEIQLQSKLETEQTNAMVEYSSVIALKEAFEEYREAINEIDNEKILKKSLTLGELSLIDYLTELHYYYELNNMFFQLERDYYLALAQLFKHRY